MQRVQHRRFADPAANWPASPVMAGEVVVNPVRHALGIGDLDGTVRSIVDVRPFDERSQYLVGDLVTQAGTIWRCKTAIGVPHAFLSTEWDPVGQTTAEMYPLFDLRYASIGHNHDGVYATAGHLHDDRYSLLGHTHSGYATADHNHDGVYAKLEGGNMFTGGQNFMDIVNFQGSYVAVFGSLSVGAGTGFVPASAFHVRQVTGIVTALIEAASASQARLTLKNSNRDYLLFNEENGALVGLYDLSAGRMLQQWRAPDPGTGLTDSTVFGPFRALDEMFCGNSGGFGSYTNRMGRRNVGGVTADFYQGGTGYIAFHSEAGPLFICDISPGGAGPGLPGPLYPPGTAGLRIRNGEMIWSGQGPDALVGHTFLRDGILSFRAFPDSALPNPVAYPGAIVFSATVPGRMWMTNDGLSWKRQDFG